MKIDPNNTKINFEEYLFCQELSEERKKFKAAKIGTGENNFDLMADAVENIKSYLKAKSIKMGNGDKIKKVETIINWYREKEIKYSTVTPDGAFVNYPPQMAMLCNNKLTIAFEILMDLQHLMGLI